MVRTTTRLDCIDLGFNGKAAALVAGVYVAVIGLAAACVVLARQNDSHRDLIYLGLLYVVVLPLLVAYCRSAKDRAGQTFRVPRLLAIAAGGVFLITALCTSASIGHGRVIPDESAYRFQARILAAGKLKAEPMPGALSNPTRVPTAIYFEHTIQVPYGWFAKYPLGWPVILAAGTRLRLPWALNPLFGVLQLLLIWPLARRWGPNTQAYAVLIAAMSPYAIVNNVGYMSHASEALLALLALIFAIEGTRRQRLVLIAASFTCVLLAVLVRPYTGAVLGFVCTVIVIVELRSRRRVLIWALAIVAVAAIASIAATLIDNRAFTGHALLSPYALMRGGTKVQELTTNASSVLTNLLQRSRWSVASTLSIMFPFVILLAAFACWKETRNRRELIYLSSLFPLLIAAYCFQSESSGSVIGERYYYEGFCPLAVAAACGLDLLITRWRVRWSAVAAALAALVALQAVMLIVSLRQIEDIVRPYNQAYAVATSQPEKPLVFVQGFSPYFMSKHVNWNNADWRHAPVVYLNDPGAARRDPTACLLGRTSYRVVRWDPQRQRVSKVDANASCRQ